MTLQMHHNSSCYADQLQTETLQLLLNLQLFHIENDWPEDCFLKSQERQLQLLHPNQAFPGAKNCRISHGMGKLKSKEWNCSHCIHPLTRTDCVGQKICKVGLSSSDINSTQTPDCNCSSHKHNHTWGKRSNGAALGPPGAAGAGATGTAGAGAVVAAAAGTGAGGWATGAATSAASGIPCKRWSQVANCDCRDKTHSPAWNLSEIF